MERLALSIEMEPRTLNEGELNHAREAAVDIIQKEPREASTIFTEGMRDVVSIGEMEEEIQRRDQFHKLLENNKESAEVTHGSWDLPCSSTTFEELFPDKTKIREPHSAPF